MVSIRMFFTLTFVLVSVVASVLGFVVAYAHRPLSENATFSLSDAGRHDLRMVAAHVSSTLQKAQHFNQLEATIMFSTSGATDEIATKWLKMVNQSQDELDTQSCPISVLVVARNVSFIDAVLVETASLDVLVVGCRLPLLSCDVDLQRSSTCRLTPFLPHLLRFLNESSKTGTARFGPLPAFLRMSDLGSMNETVLMPTFAMQIANDYGTALPSSSVFRFVNISHFINGSNLTGPGSSGLERIVIEDVGSGTMIAASDGNVWMTSNLELGQSASFESGSQCNSSTFYVSAALSILPKQSSDRIISSIAQARASLGSVQMAGICKSVQIGQSTYCYVTKNLFPGSNDLRWTLWAAMAVSPTSSSPLTNHLVPCIVIGISMLLVCVSAALFLSHLIKEYISRLCTALDEALEMKFENHGAVNPPKCRIREFSDLFAALGFLMEKLEEYSAFLPDTVLNRSSHASRPQSSPSLAAATLHKNSIPEEIVPYLSTNNNNANSLGNSTNLPAPTFTDLNDPHQPNRNSQRASVRASQRRSRKTTLAASTLRMSANLSASIVARMRKMTNPLNSLRSSIRSPISPSAAAAAGVGYGGNGISLPGDAGEGERSDQGLTRIASRSHAAMDAHPLFMSSSISASPATNRTLSIIHADIDGFHNWLSDDATIIAVSTDFVKCVTKAVQDFGGVCGAVMGDKLLGFFNMRGVRSDHSIMCVRAAVRIKKDLGPSFLGTVQAIAHARPVINVRIACSCGVACFGNMGTVRRTFTVVSPSISRCYAMQKLSKLIPMEIVCDEPMYNSIRYETRCRLAAMLVSWSPAHSTSTLASTTICNTSSTSSSFHPTDETENIYEILSADERPEKTNHPTGEDATDGWMAQTVGDGTLERTATFDYNEDQIAFERGVRSAFQGDSQRAQEQFQAHLSQFPGDKLAHWYLKKIPELDSFTPSQRLGFCLPLALLVGAAPTAAMKELRAVGESQSVPRQGETAGPQFETFG